MAIMIITDNDAIEINAVRGKSVGVPEVCNDGFALEFRKSSRYTCMHKGLCKFLAMANFE